MDRGKEKDFYRESNFLKSFNRGKVVYYRPIKLVADLQLVQGEKHKVS